MSNLKKDEFSFLLPIVFFFFLTSITEDSFEPSVASVRTVSVDFITDHVLPATEGTATLLTF